MVADDAPACSYNKQSRNFFSSLNSKVSVMDETTEENGLPLLSVGHAIRIINAKTTRYERYHQTRVYYLLQFQNNRRDFWNNAE